jgi:hypothetical protein
VYIVQIWSALFSWEIARKIRSPEEETAYVTYSRILGPAGAVALAGGAQTLALAGGVYLYFDLSLSPAFLALSAAGYAQALWVHARFLRSLGPEASRQIRPGTERFCLAVIAAHILEHLLLR